MLFGVKQHCGHDFFLPSEGAVLWDCFDLDVPAAGPECPHRFHERNGSCNFDARVFEQPDGTVFDGFFQSYRYFDHCRGSLLQFLRFRAQHRAYSEALLFALRRRHRRPLVAVHVRRQDYVKPGYEDHWGDLVRDGYYERAVETIGDGVTYLVFSDDMEWCRQSLAFGSVELDCIEFVEVDTHTALCMMAGCDVNVIANSSFSWWAAYLNPQAEVYAPSRWFGPAMPPPNDRQDDIVHPSWRQIPVLWS